MTEKEKQLQKDYHITEEQFQRIYDEAVSRDVGKDKAEDKMWNRGRGR